MVTVQLIATAVCLAALVAAMNILTWWGIQRTTPGRPWHWTVMLGAFAYYPWLNRQERLTGDVEPAERKTYEYNRQTRHQTAPAPFDVFRRSEEQR